MLPMAFRQHSETRQRVFSLDEIADSIRRLHEIDTLVLRLSALTGDGEWKNRHLDLQAELKQRLNAVKSSEVAPSASDLIAEIEALNAQAEALSSTDRRFDELATAQARLSEKLDLLEAAVHRQIDIVYHELRDNEILMFTYTVVLLLFVILSWFWLYHRASIQDINRLLQEKVDLYARLERSASDHERIFNLAPWSILYKDKHNNILRANQMAADMAGVNAEEMRDQPVSKFYGPELANLYYLDDLDVIRSGKPKFNIREPISTGYKTIWARTTKVPIFDSDHQVQGVIAFIEDITEEHRLQEQLSQAGKMEAIGRLAGGVAHDFNNKLNAIIMTCELAMDDLSGNEASIEPFKEILQVARKSADLTRQLLAFSRQQVLAPEILDLNDAVLESERMVRRLIGEQLDFELRLAPGVPEIRVDRTQLGQVLLNLCINARDSMPNGGKLVVETFMRMIYPSVSKLGLDLNPGIYSAITVTDTGTGMDAATKARIFEPFFTTKGPYQGTGLGLATVEGIVRQSGGVIWVDSEIGKGSTFTVLLPAFAPPRMGLIGQDQASSREQIHESLPGGRETIFLVEDDDRVRELSTVALTKYGYKVVSFSHPRALLELDVMSLQDADLLFTDVVLPEIDGPKLAEYLRSKHPDLKVMFTSGYTEDVVKSYGLGPKDVVIRKPASISELIECMRKVLDAA
jgi:PAS domain S-box-containing protein